MENTTIKLSYWDILDYKIWDKVCALKGKAEDFIFEPFYENEYSFEFSANEINELGVPQSA